MVNCYSFCLFVIMMLKMIRGIFSVIVCFLILIGNYSSVFAQKPGKEKIEIKFPAEIKWKKSKIKGESASIRQEIFTPSSSEGDHGIIKVDVLTIDKRFYPISARETFENSWQLRQSICPNSSLDVLFQEKDEKGVKIIYVLQNPNSQQDSTKGEEAICQEPVWFFMAAEGPTAMHTIEVHIENGKFNSEISKRWVEILKNRVIK